MRLLLTGAGSFLGRAVHERLDPGHEILRRDSGQARDFVGCQAMIHLWDAQTEALEASAIAAGVRHIVRVVPWSGPREAPAAGCTLVCAPLIGPGDPEGTVERWLGWAQHRPPPEHGATIAVDHRDATGAIESALWKGTPGRIYPIVGPSPSLAELHAALSDLPQNSSPPHPPPEDTGPVDLSPTRDDLGWWHRTLERSLQDTVAGL